MEFFCPPSIPRLFYNTSNVLLHLRSHHVGYMLYARRGLLLEGASLASDLLTRCRNWWSCSTGGVREKVTTLRHTGTRHLLRCYGDVTSGPGTRRFSLERRKHHRRTGTGCVRVKGQSHQVQQPPNGKNCAESGHMCVAGEDEGDGRGPRVLSVRVGPRPLSAIDLPPPSVWIQTGFNGLAQSSRGDGCDRLLDQL